MRTSSLVQLRARQAQMMKVAIFRDLMEEAIIDGLFELEPKIAQMWI